MDHQLTVWLGGLGLLCSVSLGCSSDSGTNPHPGTTGTPTGAVGAPTQANPGAGFGSPTNPGTKTNPTPTNPGTGTQPAPGTGIAGTGGGMLPVGNAGAPATMPPGPTTMPPTPGVLAMNECGLHTKYAGDEYCILPPPKDKGFQLHIGPTNYDNPEPQYLLPAGAESTPTFTAMSGNDKPIYFYYRQFRMRPGAHHNIITSGAGGDTGLGQRIGTSNNLAEDNPKDGMVAPENKGVGISMPAYTSISVSLHSINATSQTELREIWVNFWYRDPAEVTDPVREVFSIAAMGPIAPGQDVLIPGSCNVVGTGRMLWMYGHRHANNVRFSTWRVRGGKTDLVYQAYNWEDPLVLEYSSTVKNAVPDTGPNVEGGWSGPLDIMTGDQLTFECHVINKTQGVLNFTNNTYTGEMCILDAELVGASCN